MPIELKVPPVGESITEVQIGEWLKSEGDAAERDEVIVKIETDKVTVDLPAPVKGVITQILVKAGQPATVGQVIGYMEEGEARAAARSRSACEQVGCRLRLPRPPAKPRRGPALPCRRVTRCRPRASLA